FPDHFRIQSETGCIKRSQFVFERFVLKPFPERDAKSSFRSTQQGRGESFSNCISKHAFSLVSFHLNIPVYFCHILYKTVIQKRHACFERRGHAHSIHFSEKIIRKQNFKLKKHELIKRMFHLIFRKEITDEISK